MTTPFIRRGIWRSQWPTLAAGTAAAPALTFTGDTNTGIFSPAADTIAFAEGGVESMRIDASGNLGIGTASPTRKLQVNTGGGQIGLESYSTGSKFVAVNSANNAVALLGVQANQIDFLSGSSGAVTAVLDSSGNLGLGVTPSAWWANSRAAQFGIGGVLEARTNSSITTLGSNYFLNSSLNRVYLNTDSASMYVQNGGAHQWHTAPSGTAGTAITFTQAMTLDASGNLGVGTASFGTSAVKVLAIASGTEPTTGPADTIQIYSVDRSAGNTIPAIYCEGSGVTNAAITNVTVTNKIAIKVNGTIYYLLATTSAS
jgi:hypothetical protein